MGIRKGRASDDCEHTPAKFAEAADVNFVVHVVWAAKRTAGMHVIEDDELVIADSGLPCDTFNFVCRARLSENQAKRRTKEAVQYFRKVSRPFSWWVGPADRPVSLGRLLSAAGLEQAETEVAMAADLAALRLQDVPPGGMQIRRVRTPAELREFARLAAANWDPPDPYVIKFYELTAEVLLSPRSPQWFYVGYLDETAVATAELTVDDGAVGLYNISTLQPYRRRGIGTAMTLQPLVDARAQGHRMGVLQAATDGVGIYQRLGFQRFGDITEYKPLIHQASDA